jgi:hypothetical protein
VINIVMHNQALKIKSMMWSHTFHVNVAYVDEHVCSNITQRH